MEFVAYLLLFLKFLAAVNGSMNDEFGVDHKRDQNDPAYKYKMRGEFNQCTVQYMNWLEFLVSVLVFCVCNEKLNRVNFPKNVIHLE